MPTHQHRLVRTFVELADTLVSDFDVTEVLYTLVESLMELFGVAGVGLMLVDDDGNLSVVASSGEKARIIELLELQRRQGPCYEAFASGKYVVSNDLAADRHRWPEVIDEVVAAGFSVVHAVPMRLRDHVIGAINLFEVAPGSVTVEDVPVIRGMAEIATIAILQARAMREVRETADQLQIALRTRVTLEQAKGMLSQVTGTSVEDSFVTLRKYARDNGLRLAEVARRVVEGEILVGEFAADSR